MQTLVCLTFFALVSHVLCQQTDTIGYQGHSINDLREWNQLIRKGMTWVKVDLYYMNHDFCSKYNSTLSDKRGCFLLTHDLPTPRNPNYFSHLDLLQHVLQFQSKLYIALCFKPERVNNCIRGGENWLSLIDSMLPTLVSSRHEFFLDGNAKADRKEHQCLAQRWRPLKSMWIREPADALHSNDASLGYDRFQVVNQKEGPVSNPGERIRFLQAQNYGKFANSSYPWVLWEPSDQFMILNISSEYMRYYPRMIHSSSFRFSINIDPIQFEVFAGSKSGIALNHDLKLKDTTNPHLIILNNLSLMIGFISKNRQNEYFTIKLHSSVPSTKSFDGIRYLTLDTKMMIHSVSQSYLNQQYFVTLSDNNGNSRVYVWQNGLVFHKEVTRNIPFSYAIMPRSNLVSTLIFSQRDCSLNWNGTHCLVKDQGLIQDVSMDILEDDVLIAYSLQKKIYLCHFRISNQSCHCSRNPIDVGAYPKVSLVKFKNQVHAMIVSTDGYCYNSHRNNIQSSPYICDIIPKTTPKNMIYNYGKLDDFISLIQAPVYVSSCHPRIFHGVYDLGDSMSVQLFVKETLGVLEIHKSLGNDFRSNSDHCGVSIYKDTVVVDSWRLPNL